MLAGAEGEGRAAGRLAGRPPSGAQGPAARDSGCIRRRAAARPVVAGLTVSIEDAESGASANAARRRGAELFNCVLWMLAT
jgi:hypothetical protein